MRKNSWSNMIETPRLIGTDCNDGKPTLPIIAAESLIVAPAKETEVSSLPEQVQMLLGEYTERGTHNSRPCYERVGGGGELFFSDGSRIASRGWWFAEEVGRLGFVWAAVDSENDATVPEKGWQVRGWWNATFIDIVVTTKCAQAPVEEGCENNEVAAEAEHGQGIAEKMSLRLMEIRAATQTMYGEIRASCSERKDKVLAAAPRPDLQGLASRSYASAKDVCLRYAPSTKQAVMDGFVSCYAGLSHPDKAKACRRVSQSAADGCLACWKHPTMAACQQASREAAEGCQGCWLHPTTVAWRETTRNAAGLCMKGSLNLAMRSCLGCMVVAVECLPGSTGEEGEEDLSQEDRELRAEFAKGKEEFVEAFVARGAPEPPSAAAGEEGAVVKSQEQIDADVVAAGEEAERQHHRRRLAEELLDPSRRRAEHLERVVKDQRRRIFELESDIRKTQQANDSELRKLKAVHLEQTTEAAELARSKAERIAKLEAENAKLQETIIKELQAAKQAEVTREAERILSLKLEFYVSPAAWGFAVLGAEAQDPASVQRTFRSLIRMLHPDRAGGASDPRHGDAAAKVKEAKELCERFLTKKEPPQSPKDLRSTVLSAMPGRRAVKLQWTPPPMQDTAPVRRFLVQVLDPAFGREVTVTVLEPDYREDLQRFQAMDELTSYVFSEQEWQKLPQVWAQQSITFQVAAVNEVAQSPWAVMRVPLPATQAPQSAAQLRRHTSASSPLTSSRVSISRG